MLIEPLHRSRRHDGRARNCDDEDAQGPITLVEQLAARPYHRAGTHNRSRRRRFMGVRYCQTCARARRERGPGQGGFGASRF
jgi:hypothetical protein